MSQETIIFSMAGVGKNIPPNRQILKNIYLSFFYGAKIGVLGLNGSGKSTLMRIIAGIDKNYTGEVVFSPGYSVGMLEQEPQFTPGRTVREVVEEGVQEVMNLLKEFEEINEAFGDPEADFDKLIARQGEVQEKIDHVNGWEIDQKLERRSAAHRPTRSSTCCPGANDGAWPCADCCSNNPTCSCSMSQLTTSTPSRCCGSKNTCANTPER